jgi:cysteine desulfurase family protein (TIGR01976 family)
MALDLDFVRSQFPALAEGFVYFDNAGGSAVLKTVADRVYDTLTTTSVQTGASYVHSQRATRRLAEARSRFAHLVGATRPEEIIIGPTSTVLCQNLARAMKGRLQAGDDIIVTAFDHESNIGPWRWLEQFGINIKVWGIDRESLEIDLEALDALMTPRTRLVAVTHTSNILGTINPIADIAARVHAHGADIAVDAVAYAPHRLVDVVALDVDYYFFSFYKTYGPHLAMMYGKYEKLLELDGLYHYFYGKAQVPQKLEPGNANYELAWGAAGIVDYLDELGGGTGDRAALGRAFDDIAMHEARIGERLLSYLRDRNDIQIFGRRDSQADLRVPTISFKVDGRDSAEIAKAVDAAGIGIRFGDFHSRGLVEMIGAAAQSGVLRVSMVHYNTLEEVDRLIAWLDQVL